jgi:hypothetical protein
MATDRRRRRYRIADSDNGFLRDPRTARLHHRENRRTQKRECQAGPIRAAPVRIVTVQHRDRSAQRRNLRQRQIHENHAALDHVDAEIGVNPRQNQTRDKWGQQEVESVQ